MPAIVDRSPVIVAIGTSGHLADAGATPAAQLEALLPERLGELARLGGTVCASGCSALLPDSAQPPAVLGAAVCGQYRHASARRAGRERRAAARAELELQARCRDSEQRAAQGEVYLIGAGPGDPDLLTLRALQLLQQADVVLYDRLVSEAVLGACARDAERVFVGKESGQHRVTQERIHALMLRVCGTRPARGAAQGRRSVRCLAAAARRSRCCGGGHSGHRRAAGLPRRSAPPRAAACR